MLRIVVPGTPQGKGRPRFVRKTGRVYTPAQTESYEAKLAYFAREAMTAAGLEMLPNGTGVYCRVTAVFAVPASWSKKKKNAALCFVVRPTSKPDVDNIFKVVGDSLNSIVWSDDAAIVAGEILKVYGEEPRLVIEVQAASSAHRQPVVAEAA